MWLIAVATVVAIGDFRWHVEHQWSPIRRVEGAVALAGVVFVCARWRGRVVNGFVLVFAGLAVLSMIRSATGH